MRYQITIDETQRQQLISALRITADIRPLSDDEGLLHDMLDDLPANEGQHPGAMHSFCD